MAELEKFYKPAKFLSDNITRIARKKAEFQRLQLPFLQPKSMQ
jgi:hypothetical protein